MSLLCHWDKIPNFYNLKEEKFILTHGLGLQLAGPRAEMACWKGMADKSAELMTASKQSMKWGAKEGDVPFQVMPPSDPPLLIRPPILIASQFNASISQSPDKDPIHGHMRLKGTSRMGPVWPTFIPAWLRPVKKSHRAPNVAPILLASHGGCPSPLCGPWQRVVRSSGPALLFYPRKPQDMCWATKDLRMKAQRSNICVMSFWHESQIPPMQPSLVCLHLPTSPESAQPRLLSLVCRMA